MPARRRRPQLGLDVRFWSLHSWTWDDRLADADIAARIHELAAWLLDGLDTTTARPLLVDVGCGTGNHTAALVGGGAGGGAVVGLDFAPAMLARAAAKTTRAAFVRADLRHGLPLRAHAVDGALSVYVAQFFELDAFLADVARVLRPGGVLVLELPRPGARRATPPHLSWRHRGFQRINRAAASVGRRAGAVRVRPAAEVDAALDIAGFEVVGHRDTDRSLAVRATFSP